MRAAYGAAGVDTEGSPLDVLESSASALEKDKQNINYHGELRAMSYESSAELDRFSGESAVSGSYLKAGSALLSGAGQAAYYGSGLSGSSGITQKNPSGSFLPEDI